MTSKSVLKICEEIFVWKKRQRLNRWTTPMPEGSRSTLCTHGKGLPVITANHNWLSTRATDCHSKLFFIIISGVVKVLQDPPWWTMKKNCERRLGRDLNSAEKKNIVQFTFFSISYNSFVTSCCYNWWAPTQGIWGTRMFAKLTLNRGKKLIIMILHYTKRFSTGWV